MKEGDVVLVQYSSKSRSGEYRLARVIAVETDEDGLVRTCTVKYSLLQHLPAKERLAYKGITNKYLRLAVQRLVLILPVEEQVDFPVALLADKQEAEKLTSQESSNYADSKAVLHVKLDTGRQKSMVMGMLKDRHQFNMLTKGWVRTDEQCNTRTVQRTLWTKKQDCEVTFSDAMLMDIQNKMI